MVCRLWMTGIKQHFSPLQALGKCVTVFVYVLKKTIYISPVGFQIVGLTASVGVGKKPNLEGAMEHILRLCANLDAQTLKPVTRHRQQLSEHVSTPAQGNDDPS